MTKIFLLLNQDESENTLKPILEKNSFETMCSVDEIDDILVQIHNFMPDIILIDNDFNNCEYVIRQIKSNTKNQNIQFILLLNNDKKTGFMNLVDGLIVKPISEDILISTLNSHLKIKKSLDRLYENNKELSRSLYQLNVLYNTSSQFAGTLNTSKLYDIMIEAMEKTLSFDISSVLVYTSSKNAIFKLNTIHTPAQNLIDALKIRSILNYKNVIENSSIQIGEFSDIEVIQKVKQARSNKIYGIESINFDSLFAPIKVGEDFFGVVELFRSTPFCSEDVTCFQAITHQVALPLRSAKLYEEISITNKKLEKLEKLKSEFVSIVSHELRTPLTPINNSLEIVLSGQAGVISKDAQNFILMAKRNIQRLSGIIEDLLDLSRIQAGKLDFKYKIVDIAPSVELLQKTFLQVASEKNIKINLDIEEKLPEIYADTRRIEQILTNLVSNSIKFTPQDGTIKVSAHTVDADEINFSDLIMPYIKPNGKYIKITVEDTGIGIKKEDIPKIFDKFSQIESSLNRNACGVGLGLTITKQLVDSHLGAIWVESEEAQGSKFNVILPLVDKIKMFEMDLSRILINNEDTGIIRLEANKDLNLINSLKENKLLNLSRLSKEIEIEEDGKIIYYTFIPKITSSSFEALISTIKEYCSKIKKNEYDIILSKAHSKNDGVDACDIIKILNISKENI